jgi:site-specific DNA-methyltransferase (adenine-specific)
MLTQRGRHYGGRIPESLAGIPDATYHGILTDPPFGLSPDLARPEVVRSVVKVWLAETEGVEACERAKAQLPRSGMLGRAWDNLPPSPATWAELLRVTRPGGLCIAYSHGSVYGLMELAARLAGWEVLPMMVRIHGGAMALGMDVSKAIDKAAGAEREVIGRESTRPTRPNEHALVGRDNKGIRGRGRGTTTGIRDITAPATPEAERFAGHNTAIKNASDPILVLRKPPEGTWAENAVRWGCGAFNVDAARIPAGVDYEKKCAEPVGHVSNRGGVTRGKMNDVRGNSFSPKGRMPSTVMLEHLDGCGPTVCLDGCPVATVGEQTGWTDGRGPRVVAPSDGPRRRLLPDGRTSTYVDPRGIDPGDSGTGARFFYQARASAAERHRGAESCLWVADRQHPDGWRLVDREEYERVGETCVAEAMASERYAEMMALGYMRRSHGNDDRSEIDADASVYGKGLNKAKRLKPLKMIEDDDRLDAKRFLEVARESKRCAGNPHLAVKPSDGGAQLARLILQPDGPDGEPPRLLVPWSGSESEVIAAALAGWRLDHVDTAEMSEQWPVVGDARVRWWAEAIERQGSGKAIDTLRAMATGADPEPEEDPQLTLFP